VRVQLCPSRFANALASSCSRLVCGATPRLPSGRAGSPEPFHEVESDFVGGDPELGEHAAGELVGLSEQANEKVLGTQVRMAVLAGGGRGGEAHRRSRPSQPGWQFPGRVWASR